MIYGSHHYSRSEYGTESGEGVNRNPQVLVVEAVELLLVFHVAGFMGSRALGSGSQLELGAKGSWLWDGISEFSFDSCPGWIPYFDLSGWGGLRWSGLGGAICFESFKKLRQKH